MDRLTGKITASGVVLLTLFVTVLLGFLFAVPIAALAVSAENSALNCSTAPLVEWPLWLNVYGGVNLSALVWLLIGCAIFLAIKRMSLLNMTLWAIPVIVFHICWSIIGGITLWRDMSLCPSNVTAMILAALICMWLELAVYLGLSIALCKFH